MLEDWYRCDGNIVPRGPSEADPDRGPLNYILQPRTQNLRDGRDYTRRTDDPAKDTQDWLEVQGVLWRLVNAAFPATGRWLDCADWPRHVADVNDPVHPKPAIPQLARFQASATEQEIWCGALSAAHAERHVIACFRQITNRDDFTAAEAKEFFDVSEGDFDATSARRQADLKAAIERRLGENMQLPIPFSKLKRELGKVLLDAAEADTTAFCNAVFERFRPIIERQIKEYWDNSAKDTPARATRELKIEQEEHTRFGRERGGKASFVGRNAELEAIQAYLNGDNGWPLAVHGSSGCGKTALLWRAYEDIPVTRMPIIRLIGTTPHSSDLRSLLGSLCQELRQRNPRAEPLPIEIKELREEFSGHLQAATAEQPLILFLDALDQLADADNGRLLSWLPLTQDRFGVPPSGGPGPAKAGTPNTQEATGLPPGSLPPHVKLVVSCLSDRGATDDPAGQPYAELKRRPIPAENFINLDVLSEAEARLLLFDRWLAKAGRKVSAGQRACIEQRLASPACRQPIYLKLLFEEVQLWHSYDSAPVPGESVPALLGQLFDRLSRPTNHGPLLVNRVLGYLSASRHGLAENEILEILFADPEYRAKLAEATERTRQELPPNAKRIPIALWSRLRFDLDPYLTVRAAAGANVLTFYHRQLAEWVQERLAKAPDQAWQPHPRLADYFDAQWPMGDHHALHEVVYQMSGARQLDRLDALLGRFEFLRRRASREMQSGHTGAYDLLDDLNRILEVCDDSEPARLLVGKVMDLRAMLGMEAPFLSLFPAALAQCCLNSVSESVRGLAEAALDSLNLPERLWTFSSRRFGFHAPQVTLVGHSLGILDCCLADGDRTVVSVAGMDPAILWNARTGSIVRMIDAGRVPPSSTSRAAQNFGNLVQTMATGSRIALLERHRLHLLDLMGTPIRTVEFESADEAHNGVASSSHFFVSLYYEIWEIDEEGEMLHAFREHAGNQLVHSLDVTPAGSHLVSVDRSGHIVLRARKLGSWETLWESVVQYEADLNYEIFLREMDEWDWGKQNYEGATLKISLDSAASVVALAVAGRFQVFDATSRERVVPTMSTAEAWFLERVGLGREFAFFGGCRGSVRCIDLFDIDSQTRRVVSTLLEDTPSCASVSADGGTLVVGSYEIALVVTDTTRAIADTGGGEADLPSDYVIGAALSLDEEYVACWSIDHKVVVWHARSGQIRYRWNGRERNADAGDRLNDVQFGPGGDWLAITRGERKKCRTLIVDLSCNQLKFDTERILGFVDGPLHLCRERFVCRFSPDGFSAALLTHHELWIVNLSRSEIDFRVDVPEGLLHGGDVSMEWAETVLIRVESCFGLTYYRLGPRSMIFEEVDSECIEGERRIGEHAYPVERSGTRSVSMTSDVDLRGQPPVLTRVVRICDEEREWCYAMPAAVSLVGLAPKSGYVVAGDKAGNFTTLWPREGVAD